MDYPLVPIVAKNGVNVEIADVVRTKTVTSAARVIVKQKQRTLAEVHQGLIAVHRVYSSVAAGQVTVCVQFPLNSAVVALVHGVVAILSQPNEAEGQHVDHDSATKWEQAHADAAL